jgi:hypothetical protein
MELFSAQQVFFWGGGGVKFLTSASSEQNKNPFTKKINQAY